MKAWVKEKMDAKAEAESDEGLEANMADDDESDSDSSMEGEKLGDRLFKKKPRPQVDLNSIKLELE